MSVVGGQALQTILNGVPRKRLTQISGGTIARSHPPVVSRWLGGHAGLSIYHAGYARGAPFASYAARCHLGRTNEARRVLVERNWPHMREEIATGMIRAPTSHVMG